MHVNHLWILQVSSSQFFVLDQFQKLINMVHAFPLCLSDIRCSPVRPNPSDMEHLWRRAPSTRFGPSTFRVSSNATSELPEIAGFWTRTESRCVLWLLVFHNSMVGSSFQLVQYGSITTGWWLGHPPENMNVNWDDEIPNIWENRKWQPTTNQTMLLVKKVYPCGWNRPVEISTISTDRTFPGPGMISQLKCSHQTSRSNFHLFTWKKEKLQILPPNLCSSVNQYPRLSTSASMAPRKPWQVARKSAKEDTQQSLPFWGRKQHPKKYMAWHVENVETSRSLLTNSGCSTWRATLSYIEYISLGDDSSIWGVP